MNSKSPVGTLTISETELGQLNVEISVGSLYPILPQTTGRYDVGKKVSCSHAVVEAGMFLSSRAPVPLYLPQHWSAYTHPEGKTYFGRNAPLPVVTDSYLYDPAIADKIVSWVSYIEKQANEKSFTLTDTVELYLQIEGDDCNYYFADHATRTLFWLDNYETTELGLLPVVSSSHLKLQLEEQYWTHLEYFCMHPLNLQSNIIDELISQLIHACGDHITSQSSTFPYDVKECRRLLKILSPARDRRHDGHVLTLVARLNNVISNNRYWTHYGQEQARLSRDTSIVVNDHEEFVWTANIISGLSLRTSEYFHARLNTIFTDNYVYGMDWKALMSECFKRWKGSFHFSLGTLTLHIFCFFLPVSQSLATVSASLLSLSLISSALLIHSHQALENGGAGDAYQYLNGACFKYVRLQGLALLFALPQAFSLWGLVALSSQALLFIAPVYLLFLAGALALSALAIKCHVSPPSSSWAPSFTSSASASVSSTSEKHCDDLSSPV